MNQAATSRGADAGVVGVGFSVVIIRGFVEFVEGVGVVQAAFGDERGDVVVGRLRDLVQVLLQVVPLFVAGADDVSECVGLALFTSCCDSGCTRLRAAPQRGRVRCS
ncbi:hypothetical protein [Streptomyces brasiliensis]|uniref:hypothetical protein n=1 Tax=Streptomyces brasiliensis TaxID=1954 RepID=UPI001670614C|nr:hypothetical protein [Streptomyces brasiliensis]